jgi:hypothetical protein
MSKDPHCDIRKDARQNARHLAAASQPKLHLLIFIASIAMLVGVPKASAEGSISKAALDQCERTLSKCYEDCEAKGAAPSTCNKQCTTDKCPLPWTETYGTFLDRRIEDLPAGQRRTAFVGLTRLKNTQK